MVVSKSNDNIQNAIMWMIWLFLLVVIFKASVLIGIILILLTFYLYSKLVYKVILDDGVIMIKYLFDIKTVHFQDIKYVEISKVRPSLGLNLSLLMKVNKKRYNFSNGDTENLVLMLNYFIVNRIKILDDRNLLNSLVKFDGNSYYS